MNRAVIYARVSSKDKEREGFSIPAQLKLLREYAKSNEFEIVREFVEVETAKVAGRKKFAEMVCFFNQTPSCRILIVEKTDRLYRNLRDCVTLEDLEIEIHLPKEGQIISKDSNSPAKLMHGIRVVMARNYIDNLKFELAAYREIVRAELSEAFSGEELEAKIDADLKAAVKLAEEEALPKLETMFEDVYKNKPWHLAEQQRELLAGPRAKGHGQH